jgi:deoxyribonuclease-4
MADDTQVIQHPLDSSGRCILGAHTSAAGGSWNALKEGSQIEASGVQFFTANQRQWVAKPIPDADAQNFRRMMDDTKVGVNMSHGSYLVNLGSVKEDLLEKSRSVFRQELERCQRLGMAFFVFHPGSAADSTPDACMDRIVQSILLEKDLINQGPTKVLIESTAGQGAHVGHDFAHLRYLMDKLSPEIPSIGVCIDTCHMFAAGYDIRTEEAFDKTFSEFDRVVGLKYLKAFHVNDSLSPLNSRVDRHAMLGEGHIGWLAFKLLMTDPRTAMVPKYLETPGDLSIWKREISQLRALVNGGPLPENKPCDKMKPEGGKLKKAKSDMPKTRVKKSGAKKSGSKNVASSDDEDEIELDEEDEDDKNFEEPKSRKKRPAMKRSKSVGDVKPPRKKKMTAAVASDEADDEEGGCSHDELE